MKGRVEDVSAATVVFSTTIAGGWNGVSIWIAIMVGNAIFTLASRAWTLALIPSFVLVSVLGVSA
jgi:hypothetical protein